MKKGSPGFFSDTLYRERYPVKWCPFPNLFSQGKRRRTRQKKENEILPVSWLLFVPIHPQAQALFSFPWEIWVWEKAKKIPRQTKTFSLEGGKTLWVWLRLTCDPERKAEGEKREKEALWKIKIPSQQCGRGKGGGGRFLGPFPTQTRSKRTDLGQGKARSWGARKSPKREEKKEKSNQKSFPTQEISQ